MVDVAFWERRFIQTYAAPERRERYLELLKGPKRRKKFLDLLNHKFEYVHAGAEVLPTSAHDPKELLDILSRHYVEPTCHLLADSSPYDGRELQLPVGLDELLDSCFGTIVICPPRPVALYKAEEPCDLVLFTCAAK